ncbi:hypothetical protein, partial [Aquirufa beregesia]|uniref:hypothetical protein n=1 Tax=Aquirufa beregesia TaxID=2516556 RepID=UPI00140CE0A9
TGLSGTNKLSSAGDFSSGVASLTGLGLKYTGAVGSGTFTLTGVSLKYTVARGAGAFTITAAGGAAVASGGIDINGGSAKKVHIAG